MTTVGEVVSALSAITQPHRAAAWDPVGLQIGDPSWHIDRLAVCHEVTDEVVAAIEADPAGLLITYHPLLFDPVKTLIAGKGPVGRALRLVSASISLLVTHSDFDVCPGGAADALAASLDLVDVVAFGGADSDQENPHGRVGSFDGDLSSLEILVSDRLGAAQVRVVGRRARKIGRVAVVPGSGSDLIEAAADVADVIVTGDVSHHRSVAALDAGIAVIDPGHIATERPGVRSLVEMVRSLVTEPVIDLTHLDPVTW